MIADSKAHVTSCWSSPMSDGYFSSYVYILFYLPKMLDMKRNGLP